MLIEMLKTNYENAYKEFGIIHPMVFFNNSEKGVSAIPCAEYLEESRKDKFLDWIRSVVARESKIDEVAIVHEAWMSRDPAIVAGGLSPQDDPNCFSAIVLYYIDEKGKMLFAFSELLTDNSFGSWTDVIDGIGGRYSQLRDVFKDRVVN